MGLFPGVPSYINGKMNPEYRRKYRELNPPKRKFWVHAPYSKRTQYITGDLATSTPTLADIAWAAGIYEGEGWCSNQKKWTHQAGTFSLNVKQKDRWVCDKLLSLFGGKIFGPYKNEMRTWRVSGGRARGVIYTLFSFLSPRRR